MADKLEAFLIRRDETGSPAPYEVEVPGIRDEPLMIKILPTTIASLKGLKKPEDNVTSWPIEDKIRYVREHVVDPDFASMTAEEITQQMTLWDLDMILLAAVQRGGPMRQRKEDPTKGFGHSKSV